MAEASGVIAALLVLALFFKPFFDDADEFWTCVRFWVTPDIVSLFRGEWSEDWWAEAKLAYWLLCGGAAGFAAYRGMTHLLS